MKILWKILKGLLITGAVLALLLGGAILFLSKPLPKGEPGPDADALARQVEQAINREAWERTGAIRWVFAGQNTHLWDRKRSLVRVGFQQDLVLYDLTRHTGVAFHEGKPVGEPARQPLLKKAYAAFCNDSFWLNPLVKLFDDGVTRSVVTEPSGRKSLLISYASGGVTPGDSYLWELDDNHRPTAWRMWVSIIPIKGLGASWQAWQALPTGAVVATEHKLAGLAGLKLSDIAAAPTLAELEPGADPFAALY